MSKRLNKQIVDVGGGIPALSAYAFLGVAGSVTLKGFYTDASGDQIGIAFTTTIALGNGTNEPTQLPDIPANAVGLSFHLSGDVYICLGAGNTVILADFKAGYATKYPKVAAADLLYVGRVSVI